MTNQYLVCWDEWGPQQRSFGTRREMEEWVAQEFSDPEWRELAAPKAWIRTQLTLPPGRQGKLDHGIYS